jgi:hypothetical protein
MVTEALTAPTGLTGEPGKTMLAAGLWGLGAVPATPGHPEALTCALTNHGTRKT